MNELEIFGKINTLKIKNLMRHEQFADVMDFLGLRGFKRQGEYHFLKENICLRKLHRYIINHTSELVYDEQIENPKLLPTSWKGHTREEVDATTRKRYVKQMFYEWKNWEQEAIKTLSSCYRSMIELSCVYAEYILCMMKEVEEELKYLNREIIFYEASDWDMILILERQDELHEHYKELSCHLEI